MTPQRQVKARPYDWPHDGSFSSTTTALVIIDMQRDFCSQGGYLEAQGYDITATRALIPKLQVLLEAFRSAGFPVYHTREARRELAVLASSNWPHVGHRSDLSTLSSRERFRSYNNSTKLGIGSPGPLGRLLVRGEPGHDIVPELYPLPSEPIIDKPGRGAFAHTDFELILRIKGIKNLVICGVTTDVCVSTTMREANDRAFDCLLVEDGTVASEPHLCDATIKSVQEEGGIFGAVGTLDDIVALVEQHRLQRTVQSTSTEHHPSTSSS